MPMVPAQKIAAAEPALETPKFVRIGYIVVSKSMAMPPWLGTTGHMAAPST